MFQTSAVVTGTETWRFTFWILAIRSCTPGPRLNTELRYSVSLPTMMLSMLRWRLESSMAVSISRSFCSSHSSIQAPSVTCSPNSDANSGTAASPLLTL